MERLQFSSPNACKRKSLHLSSTLMSSQWYVQFLVLPTCNIYFPRRKVAIRPYASRVHHRFSYILWFLVPFLPIHTIDQSLEGAPITKPRSSSPWSSHWPGKWRYRARILFSASLRHTILLFGPAIGTSGGGYSSFCFQDGGTQTKGRLLLDASPVAVRFELNW